MLARQLPLSKSGARAHGWAARASAGAAALALLAVTRLAAAQDSAPQSAAPRAASAARASAPAASATSGASADRAALRRAQRMLLERAKQRYEAGRVAADGEQARASLQGALDALHLAYRLLPAPWLSFNLAQVQSQLGACREAADLYRSYIQSDPAPEAKAAAEQALALLGECDERHVGPADAWLPELRVASSVDPFGPITMAPVPMAPAREPGAQSRSRLMASLPWAFGSLALISGVAGAIYWNEAHAAKRDLDRIRVGGPEVLETRERGESAQTLSRVFGGFAAGFALAAGASYWWLRHDEAHREAPLERLSLVPIEGGARAVYRSAF